MLEAVAVALVAVLEAVAAVVVLLLAVALALVLAAVRLAFAVLAGLRFALRVRRGRPFGRFRALGALRRGRLRIDVHHHFCRRVGGGLGGFAQTGFTGFLGDGFAVFVFGF